MGSVLATDCSLREFLSYMEIICLYKEVSMILEEAFGLYIMIREYMYLIQTITQNSYFILPQNLLVVWIIRGCLLSPESVDPVFIRESLVCNSHIIYSEILLLQVALSVLSTKSGSFFS